MRAFLCLALLGCTSVTDFDGFSLAPAVDAATDGPSDAGDSGVDDADGGDSAMPDMLECDEETTPCDGACVSTQSDRDHCGACGVTCGGSQTCEAGTCVVEARTEFRVSDRETFIDDAVFCEGRVFVVGHVQTATMVRTSDIFVAELDPADGSVLWDAPYASSDLDVPLAMACQGDRLYVAGLTAGRLQLGGTRVGEITNDALFVVAFSIPLEGQVVGVPFAISAEPSNVANAAIAVQGDLVVAAFGYRGTIMVGGTSLSGNMLANVVVLGLNSSDVSEVAWVSPLADVGAVAQPGAVRFTPDGSRLFVGGSFRGGSMAVGDATFESAGEFVSWMGEFSRADGAVIRAFPPGETMERLRDLWLTNDQIYAAGASPSGAVVWQGQLAGTEVNEVVVGTTLSTIPDAVRVFDEHVQLAVQNRADEELAGSVYSNAGGSDAILVRLDRASLEAQSFEAIASTDSNDEIAGFTETPGGAMLVSGTQAFSDFSGGEAYFARVVPEP